MVVGKVGSVTNVMSIPTIVGQKETPEMRKGVETTTRNLIGNPHRLGLVHKLRTLDFGILERK